MNWQANTQKTSWPPDTFAGQNVLVTAGAGGIGAAIATLFSTLGAQVVVADIRVPEHTDTSAINSMVYKKCDLGNPDNIDALFKWINRDLGGIDILVNNVGIPGSIKYIDKIDLADWTYIFNVNVNSAFICTKYAVQTMSVRLGFRSIVNISSIATEYISIKRAPYIATKSALLGLTRAMAADLGRFSIRVNAVSPGLTETGPRTDLILEYIATINNISMDDARVVAGSRNALGRIIEPTQVARAVCFLCSRYSDGITGQNIGVDGLHMG